MLTETNTKKESTFGHDFYRSLSSARLLLIVVVIDYYYYYYFPFRFPKLFRNHTTTMASRSRHKSTGGVFGRSPAFCHAHYVFRSHISVAHGTTFLRPKSSKPFWIRPLAITTELIHLFQ